MGVGAADPLRRLGGEPVKPVAHESGPPNEEPLELIPIGVVHADHEPVGILLVESLPALLYIVSHHDSLLVLGFLSFPLVL